MRTGIPFQNVAKVKQLEKAARKLPGGREEDFKKLQAIHTVRSFVVAYEGWKMPKPLVKAYRTARELTSGIVPDAIYYPGKPGFCVLYDPNLNKSVFVRESPFAYFFQVSLRSIMAVTNVTVTYPGISARMVYDFNKYLSLKYIQAEDMDDSKFD